MPTHLRIRRPALAAALAMVAVLALLLAARPSAAEEPERENLEQRHEQEFFRRIAGGEITPERVRQMWAASRALPSEVQNTEAVNSWQLAGPIFSTNPGGGFVTGRVRDIDPINIRALAASGGLWRFDIFGGIPMCDSIPASWFGSFATRPTDANTILLGTGEYRKNAGSGLYKTTDGGVTWEAKAMSPTPAWFSHVRWSPDGATAYAAGDDGLFRSTDAGETWTRTLTGPVSDFSSVPGVTGLMFATEVSLGVWKSTDGGVTWSQLFSGGVPAGVAGIGAVSAVNFPSGGNIWVYAAFDARIWRSINGAANWTEVTPGNFTIGNSGYGPTISANPTDPQTVLYGNVPLCRSTDSGTNWTKITTPHLHADYHVFAWEANTNNVWAGEDGGWSRSTDRGATWSSSSNAMPISQFYSIDCEKTEVGYMIGGTQDNNILYTPYNSLNWIDPQVGSSEGDATGAVIDLYNPQQMWAVSGVVAAPINYPRYRTTDGGTTWNQVDSGIGPVAGSGSIRTDNAFPARLVTSVANQVYESLDGVNWSLSNTFAANVLSLTSSTRVSPSAVLYVTLDSYASGQRLWVRDGGVWVERDAGLPAGRIIKVVPHPWAAYADEAWAILPGASSIWHTTNRGANWTNVTGDLAGYPVSDLVPNPRHTGELYAGTLAGCVRTKNGGVNWEHWNNGMPPNAMISEMSYIDLTGSGGAFSVVGATYGRSVFKRDVSGEDVFPTLEVSNPLVQEGDAGQDTAWFRVRIPLQYTAVTVDYSTQDSTALAGSDYVATSGSLSFAPGQTEKWIGVPVNGDTQVESDETFKLVLSNPLRALVGDPGVATIQDDDFHALLCRDRYVTDGAVNAIALSGNGVYVGGSFNKVGPATGSGVPLSATTGLPLSLPQVDGSINAVASDGAGGWFIGGGFHHVLGRPRTGLAHILADGTLAPWNPCANDYVFALAVSGNTVYAGGRFTTIDGALCHYLAAIDATTGLPTAWAPEPNDQVLGLCLNGTTLYVGGSFTTIGGKSRSYIAAVSTSSGFALTTFNAHASDYVSVLLYDGGGLLYVAGGFGSIGNQTRHYIAALYQTGDATPWDPDADQPVLALALDPNAVYAGGFFTTIGRQTRPNLVALDKTSGNASSTWTPQCDGNVLSLVASGSTLYAGGWFATIGGQSRSFLAALSTTTGLATGWKPEPNNVVEAVGVSGSTVFAGGTFTTLAPVPRASLAAYDATTGALLPWNPGAGGSVLTLVADSGLLYAGGSFTTIGGQPRNRIAALDPNSNQATAWDPNASSTVNTLLVSGSRVYAGGSFTTIGGQARNRIAALSTSTGLAVTTWNANANASLSTIVTDGTFLYVGGGFTTIGGLARNGIAMLNTTSGAANPAWNPNPNGPVAMLVYVSGGGLYIGGSFTQIAGVSRSRLCALDLNSNTLIPWAPNPNNTVSALVPYGAQVYVGGSFTAIGGQWRNHLAQLRPATNQVAAWTPEPDGNVSALMLNGSTLYVGGSFNALGGLPQAHFGCIVSEGTLDVPWSRPVAALAMRVSPNPASGPVRIEYDLPVASRVSIAVYDVQGRRVSAVLDAQREPGTHAATWEPASPSEAPAGIYFVRIKAGATSVVRRVVRL